MKKPPDKVLPNYRAIKQTLSNVVKHKHIQDVLMKTVLSAHKIVIHAKVGNSRVTKANNLIT